MIYRQTSLSKNVVQFCRFLRQHNFSISTKEERDVIMALQWVDYSNPQIFSAALQAVLCRSEAQVKLFEELFQHYWKELARAVDAKEKRKEEQKPRPLATEASFKTVQAWLNGSKNKEDLDMVSFSKSEALSQKDFSLVPINEIDELMRLLKALAKQLAAQVNRRYEKSNSSDLPDLRRTLRQNMRRGGELLDLLFRKPKRNRTRLVLLCDVSKSMELYSSFLLQFMYSFQQVYRRMETFVFGTTLQHITHLLKQNNFTQSLRLLSAQGESWNSGTRIGESFSHFVNEHAARVLNKQTIVIILSDGWDTGNTEKLSQSMEQIKARSKRMIWLNPLAGFEGFHPDTAGLQAALPYVDVLAPMHNAESLRNLGRWL